MKKISVMRGGKGHMINENRVSLDNEKNNTIHLDMRELCEVISIDKNKKIVTCDGGCTMKTLISECKKHGLLPKVLPEMPEMTVGGELSSL